MSSSRNYLEIRWISEATIRARIMSTTKDDVVKVAIDRIKDQQPQATVVSIFEAPELMEFPGRSGWLVWVCVTSDVFGVYERPIEVDGETLEARIVPYYL